MASENVILKVVLSWEQIKKPNKTTKKSPDKLKTLGL